MIIHLHRDTVYNSYLCLMTYRELRIFLNWNLLDLIVFSDVPRATYILELELIWFNYV